MPGFLPRQSDAENCDDVSGKWYNMSVSPRVKREPKVKRMPVYEYKCSKCGERFSLLETVDASREGKECPKCGATETSRTLSVFSSLSRFLGGGGDCKPGG